MELKASVRTIFMGQLVPEAVFVSFLGDTPRLFRLSKPPSA
jgi:hypothetical protein